MQFLRFRLRNEQQHTWPGDAYLTYRQPNLGRGPAQCHHDSRPCTTTGSAEQGLVRARRAWLSAAHAPFVSYSPTFSQHGTVGTASNSHCGRPGAPADAAVPSTSRAVPHPRVEMLPMGMRFTPDFSCKSSSSHPAVSTAPQSHWRNRPPRRPGNATFLVASVNPWPKRRTERVSLSGARLLNESRSRGHADGRDEQRREGARTSAVEVRRKYPSKPSLLLPRARIWGIPGICSKTG
ncbi:hypothetical protein B0J18DRAFT_207868 [Chaetomium sp. MPI-SDFR-AT-0129]|nr:hypothetical protein B0J18DRAFT_207868 [Chaetomium sp. MPI-SDFR-AT-0129]